MGIPARIPTANESTPTLKLCVNSAAEKTKEFVEGTYVSTMQAAAQFNAKLLEFARVNNEAFLSYMSELSRVKSPTDAVP